MGKRDLSFSRINTLSMTNRSEFVTKDKNYFACRNIEIENFLDSRDTSYFSLTFVSREFSTRVYLL